MSLLNISSTAGRLEKHNQLQTRYFENIFDGKVVFRSFDAKYSYFAGNSSRD